jgi:hypothetical protein
MNDDVVPPCRRYAQVVLGLTLPGQFGKAFTTLSH